MNYNEFLEKVINDGIEAVKNDYKEGDNRREGSLKGFEECRGKSPEELYALLIEARKTANDKFFETQEDDKKAVDEYWYLNSRAWEIEWVCNSVSAMLVNQGLPPLILPTCRGHLNAARILGAG